MTVQGQAQWLKYRILIFTIVGIIFTASVVGISVAFPFYSFVKADNDRSLVLVATNRARLVEGYLNSLRSIAMQVSSRTYARQLLEKYLRGDMGRQELEYLSFPVLSDAMNLLPELIAIVRHDINGQPVIFVGKQFEDTGWMVTDIVKNQPQVDGPVMLGDTHYIYVTAPIFSRKQEHLGRDVLVFDLSELKKIIEDGSGLGTSGRAKLGWHDESGMHVLFDKQAGDNAELLQSAMPLAEAFSRSRNGESGILNGEFKEDDGRVTAYSPVVNTDWGIIVTMSSDELYTSVRRQMTFTGSMMLVLIVLGTMGSFILIQPLSGKILLHADELKLQIDEKTDELKRVNQSLKALNAVNEALVRTSSESDLLGEICRTIVDVAGFNYAWIGLVDGDEKKKFHAIKEYGCQEICVDMENLMLDDVAWAGSPAGIALRTGMPSVIKDIEGADCFGKFWHKTCSCHCVAVAGFPLMIGGKFLGVLMVYAKSAEAFEDEQVSLMSRLAENLAFGLVALKDKFDRQKLQRQLLQSQKMEAIGQLTGGIAHDFNNILASILGYTELLQEIFSKQPCDKEVKDYLSHIEKSGNRAHDLVSQMLAFSRGGTSEPRPLQLQPLVKESLKMLVSTMPSSIKLNTLFDDLPVMIMMDPVQFHQLMMNLCINARDAIAGVGSIEIIVRWVELNGVECSSCFRSMKGDFVELLVRDSGTGISREVLERIFDPFFSTKEIGKGTGMGLSMVHGIMHEHGGHILVESELGKGTSFHLLFPVIDSNVQQETIVSSNGVVSGKQQEGSVKHILVVDDDVMVAEFEKEFLQKQGYQVTMKTDSREAFDVFKADPQNFDLVLTDQTMPGMTGVELAQQIMQLSPHTPVILCTGYSEYVDEQSAIQMGIHAFMDKPIDIKKLLSIIHTI